MSRPTGISAGGLALLLAWFGGAAVARLTAATPVFIVLAAGLIWFAFAAVVGFMSLRDVDVGAVRLPPVSTQYDEFPFSADIEFSRPVFVKVVVEGEVIAGGWTEHRGLSTLAAMPRRGPVDELEVRVRSAGGIGLVWWQKTIWVDIDEHLVAPSPLSGGSPDHRVSFDSKGERAGAAGAVAGETDGIRPWRDGDSERFVHWASTFRTGEFVVHDRRQDADEKWIVTAWPGLQEPDDEAGRARATIEQGLRAGAVVHVRIGDGELSEIRDSAEATRWTALADLGPAPRERRSFIRFPSRAEPESTAPLAARWWAAAATAVSMAMLADALELGMTTMALVVVGILVGASVSSRTLVTGEDPSGVVRAFVGAAALVALFAVVASSGQLDGLLALLRGPLPQILLILIVLHGFESRDRRTIRVGLSISAVVLMYASAFRVDDAIAWWLATWAVLFALAIRKLSQPTNAAARKPFPGLPRLSKLSFGSTPFAIAGGAAFTVGVLAVVPIPDSPAQLTLPSFVDEVRDVSEPGAIAGPDGEIRDVDPVEPNSSPFVDQPSRSPIGQSGGYTGFAQSMDTSIRGNLSDQVVMRVRAPEPDFWRGQTFSSFDGRRWYADEDVGDLRFGPNIDVPSSLGDVRVARDVEVEQFIQTYYIETDMPNLVFAAGRPVQVIIEADAYTRPDGAIRSTTTQTKGSVYTVVSSRAKVSADILRRQGHVNNRLSDFGRRALDKYLQVPASTSPETIDLANELASGQRSTYDIVRTYESWMSDNVEYDLHAPLPADGQDAVHDFLFNSRLGFCEQIASSLTIMLRTQGIPARLTAGYVSGSRDQLVGVFEVKASDAHAWVEVWFPESGWQPFDPTAAVPLSADATIDSVGADLVEGVGGYVSDNALSLGLLAAAGFGVMSMTKIARTVVARRRRGRWGVLQDRFAGVALRRGASAVSTNSQRASSWSESDDAAVAALVADRLDRMAFDPTFTGDDEVFRETRKLVGQLGPTAR
jgi:transglutaminase-like putative cysteine protease